MGRTNLGALLLIVVAVAAELQSTAAQNKTVGGSLGWRIPPGGSMTYATWASTQNFTLGDYLVFNFTTGQHDVAKVTKESFQACNATSPIFLLTAGPATVPLNSTGSDYFICTFSQHCASGQKLAINVTASSSAPPASPTAPPTSSPRPSAGPPPSPPSTPAQGSPSPPPPPPPPPQPSSPPPATATSAAAAAAFSSLCIFMSIAFKYYWLEFN